MMEVVSASDALFSANTELSPAQIGPRATLDLFSLRPLFRQRFSRHVRSCLWQMATSRSLRPLLMSFVAAASPALLGAQIANVNNLTTVPTPGTGHDYIQGINESVDPASGALSVRIGVPTPAGRGINLKFAFGYDSNGIYSPALEVFNQEYDNATSAVVWITNPGSYTDSPGGWSYTWPSANWTRMIGNIYATVLGNNRLISSCTVATDYLFTDSDGTRYPLYVSNGGAGGTPPCAGVPSEPWWNGTGGQGPILATLSQATSSQSFLGALVVTDGDGSVYQFQGPLYGNIISSLAPMSTVASSITDRNGNFITITDKGSGAVSATDTMGRTIVATSGFGGSSANTVTVAGTPGSYQVTWETIKASFTLATDSSVTGQCVPGTSSATLQVVSAITLPNGQQYTFGYDPAYGLLNSITYPSGASVSYKWGAATEANQTAYEFKYGPNDNYTNGCTVDLDTPVVTDRYVYIGGVNTRHDQYTYTTDTIYTSDGKPWKTTQVTSTGSGGYTRTIIYSWSPYGPPPQPWENGPPNSSDEFSFVDPAIPLEQSAVYEDGSGNVFQTIQQSWNNPRVMTSQKTELDSAHFSTEVRCYNNYEQVTQIDDYGFASDGAAGALPSCPTGSSDGSPLTPAGPLMKQSITTYANTLQSRNIVDRPQSVEEDGMTGSGQWVTPAAYTLYCYDQNTLGSVSPVQYANPGTSVRGNATQMLKWLNPPGGSNALPSCGQSTSSSVLVSNYYFDNAGQLLQVTDPRGKPTDYTWGEATGEPSIVTDGFLLRVTDPLGYYDAFTWNWANGVMTSHSDLNRQTTNFSYTNLLTSEADPFNRLGKIDSPDGGETRVYYGDNPAALYTEVQQQMNASQNTNSYTYIDGLGRTTSSCAANGSGTWDCTNKSYDGFNEQSFVSYPYTSSNNFGSSSTVGDSYYYDPLGRKTQVTHSPDSSTLSWAYSGPTETFTDEDGIQWQRTADGLSRLIEVFEPNGSSTNPSMTTTYTYDALSNLNLANQAGTGSGSARTRSFSYDSLSRLNSATNPETGTVSYGYDADGNVASQTDARSVTVNYQYDSLNRILNKTYSGDSSKTPLSCYQYDAATLGAGEPANEWTMPAAGTCAATAPSSGYLTLHSTSAYDSMGRIWNEEQCTSAGCYFNTSCPNTHSYGYDLAGNPTCSTNGIQFTPDEPSPLIFTNTYDVAGRLRAMTSNWSTSGPSPCLFSAQTTAVSGSPCTVTTPTPYAAFGGLTNGSYGNGAISLVRGYDGRLRVTSETDSQGATAVYAYSTSYTHNSNVSGLTDSVMGTWNYGYDTLNRLATSQQTRGPSDTHAPTVPFKNYCWSYDAFGNRTTEIGSTSVFASGSGGAASCPGSVPFTYSANNQINGGSSVPTYDASGDITADNNGDGNQYLYNAEGQICAMKTSPVDGIVPMTGYVYDAEQRRVAKGTITTWSCDPSTNGLSAATGETNYILDQSGNQLTEMASGSNGNMNWAHTNVWAGSQLVGTYDAGGLHYYLNDMLGTRRAQTNYAGAWQQDCSGLPYGDWLTCTTSTTSPTEHHFTGKERDQESGNDYFVGRYYANAMGRWLSPDEINETEARMLNPANTLNKYTYGANNPLKYIDPDGQDVTIFYEEGPAGGGPPGHIMMLVYDQQTGASAVESFGPDHNQADPLLTAMNVGVPGTDRFDFENFKSPDDIRSNFATITIKTTPMEAERLINLIKARSDPKYTLRKDNCTTTCRNIMRELQLTLSNSITPLMFWKDLWNEQQHNRLGWLWKPPSFKPGQDYGTYHPRYDPYRVFFDTMNCVSKTTTVRDSSGKLVSSNSSITCTQ
jgi:RHS repeat-associated protein